ncbi:MAG: hypothetical protein H7124_01795 [Phycisphaerales bacterium]|jgi:hypothetical protein|nr:hypothetical protein [Hyphomonadaceae bacterium]
MTKPQQAGGASVRELKAAALDALVKQELARKRASDAAKTARLKALRLARDAAEKAEATPKRAARKSDTSR